MALMFCLMLLADHQDVQEKLFRETQKLQGSEERNRADLVKLKYMDAVIKETLRLYPSVPFIARTLTQDVTLGDLRLRAGMEVAVHIYDLHRHPKYFPDPEKFLPERFLDGEPKHPYVYVPFSAGSRNCIGQRFAMLEMKSVLLQICRHFRVLPPKAASGPQRPPLVADLVLRSTRPIKVRFVSRE